MAVSATLYNSFKKKLLDGSNIKFNGGDTIKMALVASGYAPNKDAHDFFDDITNEVTGTGYTAGGVALANPSVTQDNTNDLAYFDADDPSWPSSTITARYAVIYKDTGTAATSPLMGYIDFGADKSTSGDTFYVQFDTAGVLKLT